MSRLSIALTVSCCLAGWSQSVYAQANSTSSTIKTENELLKKENELLKKEIELLKKEIELIKKAGGKVEAGEKPSTTVDGVKYIVDKASHSGNEAVLEIVATSGKGDKLVYLYRVEAVDSDGNVAKENSPPRPMSVTLRDGVKTRFELTVPNVRSKATEFSRIDIALDTVAGGKSITFKNVPLTK